MEDSKTDLELLQDAREENTQLQANLDAALAEVATLKTEAAEAKAEVVVLQGKLTAEEAKSADLTSKLTAEEGKSKDLSEKLTAASKQAEEAKLDAAVSRELAARYGVAPRRTDASHNAGDNGATISRADFAKLSPAAQSEFCRKGGQITEA